MCPDTELNLRDTVLGEVENNSFIALPGKGGTQWANDLKPVCSSLKVGVRRCIVMVQRRPDQFRDIFDLLVMR